MNKGTWNQLEEEFKKMVNQLDRAEAKQKQPAQKGTGNIIRRRKGEKDRRFSVCIGPGLYAAATDA